MRAGNRGVVTIWVDRTPHQVAADQTVAAALMAAGPVVRRGPDAPRGLFCGMGSCQDCRVLADGKVALACLLPVRDGLRISTDPDWAEATDAGD